MTTARDLMTTCPTVLETATVADVIALIGTQPVTFLAVTNAAGRLVGILTEYDLVKPIHESFGFDTDAGVAGGYPAYLGWTPAQLRDLKVTEIMTNDPETVTPDEELETLAQIMFRNRRKVLPVVERGHLVGAVLRLDLVKKVLG